MEISDLVEKLLLKVEKGLLTKKGWANYIGISQSSLSYKLKNGNWLYNEVEKMKELY